MIHSSSCPARKFLKLGLDKFVNLYGEKTEDCSTYGQKRAFSYYVDRTTINGPERCPRLCANKWMKCGKD